MRKVISTILLVLLLASVAFGQANGKLQLHFIDVGQGDAAILISPSGKTVMFDNGPGGKRCDKTIAYLKRLHISEINYNVVSHYHADHIECTKKLLKTFPLTLFALDRGCSYLKPFFDEYEKTVRPKRLQVSLKDSVVTLDDEENDTPPVLIEFVALNGATVDTECSDGSGQEENNYSLVAVIKFGSFRAVMGGDLSGIDKGVYRNIESPLSKKMEAVDVYKVHHHGSDTSSNQNWLDAIKPKVAIISVGDGNTHQHPVAGCLKRLHDAGVKTYWTGQGNGAKPQEHDVIGGNIRIEVEPNADEFQVICNGTECKYPVGPR
jgi:beta-lactamase superfamily II metal-dependent hydrolase